MRGVFLPKITMLINVMLIQQTFVTRRKINIKTYCDRDCRMKHELKLQEVPCSISRRQLVCLLEYL